MVCLPNLKRLHLTCMKFCGCESLASLISGCPVLEELSLKFCDFEKKKDDLFICSPSLKFLDINGCNTDAFYQVVIDTPLLETLYYDDYVPESYRVMNLSSLLLAHIVVDYPGADEDMVRYSQNVAKLVAECFNVDYLYLSMPTVNALHLSSCAMPTFSYMTELELGYVDSHGWEFLPRLLESAPYLETLVFGRILEHEGCFAKFESSIPNCVPSCLSLHLQNIYFDEFHGEQDELELVSYFLTTAEVLRVMEFSFWSSLPIEKQYITWLKLSSMEGCPRSKNCVISYHPLAEWMKPISSERSL